MAKIFICYRREDSAYPAHQICRNLADHFGSESVVFDVDTIPLGVDFREYLNNQVRKCDILLAVIGDQWIEILKQRLDEPNDFVRIEIQVALESNIPVVPVLVGKAPMPIEKNLPPEIAELAYRNAAEVRAGPDLQTHLKRLIADLDLLLTGHKAEEKRSNRTTDRRLWNWLRKKQIRRQKRKTAKKLFKNTIGMKFVLIPSGRFMMGSHISPEMTAEKYGNKSLSKWLNTEHPQHEVRISKAFYLQSTQVTQTQWERVMEYNPSHFNFEGWGRDSPVECVSWDDTQDFIKKLNEMEGTDKYRLPAESEWEWACRAGTRTDFSFGDDASKLAEYAWFAKNSQVRTNHVGKMKPNPWKLYDMHGNVWEWVEDDWHDTYNGAPTDCAAWVEKKKGAKRVLRCGGWQYDAISCRSASRGIRPPGCREAGFGFRLARSVTLGP